MRRKIIRPSAAYLPAALLAAAFLGGAQGVRWFLTGFIPISAFSLCAPEAFQRTAAAEPSAQRLRSNWTTAFLTTVFGTGVFALLSRGGARSTALCLAGGAVCLERLFGEHLYAAGQRFSAAMCAFLTAVFLGAATLVRAQEARAAWIAGAALIATAIAAVVGISIGGNPFAKPRLRIIWSVPAAVIKKAAYFAPAVALLTFPDSAWNEKALIAGFCAGWAIQNLSASTFRRAPTEAPALNAWVGTLAAVCPVVFTFFHGDANAFALPIFIFVEYALLLSWVLNGAFSARMGISIVLSFAAALVALGAADKILPQFAGRWLVAAQALCGTCLAIPDAITLFRRNHRPKKRHA